MSSILSRYSPRVPALGALPDEVSALFVLYAGPAVCAKTPSGASTGITAAKVSRPTAATVTAIMLFFLGSPAILILLVVGRAGEDRRESRASLSLSTLPLWAGSIEGASRTCKENVKEGESRRGEGGVEKRSANRKSPAGLSYLSQ